MSAWLQAIFTFPVFSWPAPHAHPGRSSFVERWQSEPLLYVLMRWQPGNPSRQDGRTIPKKITHVSIGDICTKMAFMVHELLASYAERLVSNYWFLRALTGILRYFQGVIFVKNSVVNHVIKKIDQISTGAIQMDFRNMNWKCLVCLPCD